MSGNKRIAAIIVVIVLAIFSISAIFAQDSVDDQGNPNDPNVNDRANACYAGGTMEGKCGDDSVLWGAGWYLIRFEYGIFTRDQVPSFLSWVLPPPPPEGEAADGFCTLEIHPLNVTALGLASPIVQVPLSVINGSDPNSPFGVTPYGFDWYAEKGGFILALTGPATNTWMVLWVFTDWNSAIVANDCPTPTPPR